VEQHEHVDQPALVRSTADDCNLVADPELVGLGIEDGPCRLFSADDRPTGSRRP